MLLIISSRTNMDFLHSSFSVCGGRTIQYPAGAQLPSGAANNRPPATGTSRRPATWKVAGDLAMTLRGGSFTSSCQPIDTNAHVFRISHGYDRQRGVGHRERKNYSYKAALAHAACVAVARSNGSWMRTEGVKRQTSVAFPSRIPERT